MNRNIGNKEDIHLLFLHRVDFREGPRGQ
jgi:hypothetical protein